MSNADFSSNDPVPTTTRTGESLEVDASTLAAFHSLRSLINIILVGLMVLTTSIAILMVREINIANRQTREMRGRIDFYEQNIAPRINELQSKLGAFTRVHPEFAPIYMKYFPSGTNVSAGMPEMPSAEPPPRR